jgi:hypothetical protein
MSGKKYKLLSEAQREAAIARDRGSVVRIVRVTDEGSRMVVVERSNSRTRAHGETPARAVRSPVERLSGSEVPK